MSDKVLVEYEGEWFEEPRESQIRLQFMTDDARIVIDALRRFDDLKLFEQVILMQECYRLGRDQVIDTLTPSKSVGKQEAVANATMSGILNLPDKEGVDRWTKLAQIAPNKDLKDEDQKDKPQARINRRVDFSPRAIWNLALVDQMVLASDYQANLGVLADYLDRITKESLGDLLDGILAKYGKTSMFIVFLQLRDYLNSLKETEEDGDRMTKHQISPKFQASESSWDKLRRMKKELEELPKKEDPLL